jgi:hypothetical protein
MIGRHIVKATLVGADRLGNIPDLLARFGIAVHRHVSGRAATQQRTVSCLPKGTQLLILFTDFLNHNTMQAFRRAANEERIPVLACRRSTSCLSACLERQLPTRCGRCPSPER